MVRDTLLTVHPRVWYEDVGDDKTFPYIVFTIKGFSWDGSATELLDLDIDVWDSGNSTVAIEQLNEKVVDLFEDHVFKGFRTVLDQAGMDLNESDNRIKRRKNNFKIRYFRQRRVL